MSTQNPEAMRVAGGGRQLRSEELDSLLFERIMSSRINGVRVVGRKYDVGEANWPRNSVSNCHVRTDVYKVSCLDMI